jgi:hypothetical protein
VKRAGAELFPQNYPQHKRGRRILWKAGSSYGVGGDYSGAEGTCAAHFCVAVAQQRPMYPTYPMARPMYPYYGRPYFARPFVRPFAFPFARGRGRR